MSLLLHMFDTTSSWETDWLKVDLSNGFWRMIMEAGKAYNFVIQMQGRPDWHYVIPSLLQMG